MAPEHDADAPVAPAARPGYAAIAAPAGEIDAPIHLIRKRVDGRPIDMAHAANIAVSVEDVGLDHPVSLRLLRKDERNDDGCVWVLTRGGHRLAAFELLGRRTIPAKVRDERAEVAKMAEVDENLLRRDLTPLERAEAFAERLAAWSVVHPDRVQATDTGLRAKRGRPPKWDKLAHLTGGAPALMGFAAETASVAGISQKTVGRALGIYRSIPAGQQARLHGTWIAKNDAALRQIAGLADIVEQAAVIDLLLAGTAKTVPEAQAIAAGKPVPAKASKPVQNDFEKAWKSASATQRDALLHWLSGQRLPTGWTLAREEER